MHIKISFREQEDKADEVEEWIWPYGSEFLTGGKVIEEDKKRRRSKNRALGDTRISVKGSRVAIQYDFYDKIWSDTIALQLVKKKYKKYFDLSSW